MCHPFPALWKESWHTNPSIRFPNTSVSSTRPKKPTSKQHVQSSRISRYPESTNPLLPYGPEQQSLPGQCILAHRHIQRKKKNMIITQQLSLPSVPTNEFVRKWAVHDIVSTIGVYKHPSLVHRSSNMPSFTHPILLRLYHHWHPARFAWLLCKIKVREHNMPRLM